MSGSSWLFLQSLTAKATSGSTEEEVKSELASDWNEPRYILLNESDLPFTGNGYVT